MANIVVGVFENDSDLEDAVSELLVSGFMREQVHAFSPRASGSYGGLPGESADGRPGSHEGPESISRWFGGALAEYDERAAYDDLLGRGRFILAVQADSEERVGRAVEVMNNRSPVDISEYQSLSEDAPRGRTDTAVVPEAPAEVIDSSLRERRSARRAGRIHIF